MSTAQISTVAGTGNAGFSGDGGLAADAELNNPGGVAVDSSGALYIADRLNHRVRRIAPDGIITTVAGTETKGRGGDGGPAVSAQLNGPRAVAVDGSGVLYIADTLNLRVRKVAADGVITTFAGTGARGSEGDGGAAVFAQLNGPRAVAVDSKGVVYIAEFVGNRVRRVTADGIITTVAGTGVAGFRGDGGPAVSAQLNNPSGLAVDGADNLYIADHENGRVRKVTADGTINTVAGSGPDGPWADGPATDVALPWPLGLTVDRAGVLYVADLGRHDIGVRVRKIAMNGMMTTFAGGLGKGFNGDGGEATDAVLDGASGLAVDGEGALYIGDRLNHRVRKVVSLKEDQLPPSGTVVCWANVRSRLRLGVKGESTKEGAEVHQLSASPRDYQRWRLVVANQNSGDVLFRIENVRSGKVLEVAGGREEAGAVVTQRTYGGDDAHHQQWKLVPLGAATDSPRAYEIVNRNSGLFLRAETNARGVIRQYEEQGDARNRQWQLLPV
jgi:sugar lactone lactonase YvrE